jgi:tripartite-type tricarboxylate transporter receptor subunit TctC
MKKIFLIFLFPMLAWAWEPPKTVVATTGFGPGSGNEVSFRFVSSVVEKNNPNIHFIVSNKPGAGEIVALNWFTKLTPDGSNLYIASQQGVFTGSDIWYPTQMKYNPMDLEIVTTIAKSPLCVVANINSKTNTPKELIDRIKNTKEPVTFGVGALAHRLVFEYLMDRGGGNRSLVETTLYKGPAQVMQDVAGNQIEFGILPTAIAYPLVAAGKAKFIALAGEHRLAKIPNVPLWKDTIPGLNVYGAWVITLPPGSPQEQVEYYNKLFVPAINSPEAKKLFDENLMFTVPREQTPEGARAYLVKLHQQWTPFIKKIPIE